MDQASKLRSAILKKNSYTYSDGKDKQQNSENEPRVICVSSGKGGVGKSNFTLNLALALRKKGNKVLIIDADLGLANIEILLGISPKLGLIDLVKDDINIEDIIIEGPLGLKIISGGAGISDIVDLPLYKLNKILNNIAYLKNYADFILIDTGAGISKSVMSFISSSEEIIVVTTPEPTSIADAYALIKVINKESSSKTINLVINKADTKQEAEITFNKLSLVAKKFLYKNLECLGYINNDKNVQVCVKKQTPFYLGSPNSLASQNIDIICNKLLGKKEKDKVFTSFVKKLSNLFFSNRG
ncbi:MinD/ParA family protein [Tepidibacter formicigenes]|uniref:Flagellar biosynthesis protein FlhG n=1 Tax=Tepidibacter formicigenes DSM 15518 TaxID=1123349 RepID=A0A1M6JAP0_9FIRM|nr:MinD/ParA family protein [Tepidibacter formicigenes]SHJ43759.1 flagellar biosynthesis protein FlhG [Tepidibacter formicigenes DSM 15518]